MQILGLLRGTNNCKTWPTDNHLPNYRKEQEKQKFSEIASNFFIRKKIIQFEQMIPTVYYLYFY